MLDWLGAQAAAAPERTALIRQDGTGLSYVELDRLVDQTAGRLAGLGLKPGDFLATLLPASQEHVVLVHAAARLGLVIVPLNTRLTAAELAAQLGQIPCQALIGLIDENRLIGLESLGIKLWSPDALNGLKTLEFSPCPLDFERLQGVIFTSGTAGVSKGVQLTFGNHFWSALGSAARLGMSPDDVWLSPLPLYHVGGLGNLFRCALAGAALRLCDPDPQALRVGLASGSTLVSLVPTMLQRLLALPGLKDPFNEFSKLRLILLGGAAAPSNLLTQASELGLKVVSTYGLTEAASQVATVDPGSSVQVEKKGSAGRPLMNTRLRIVDSQGRDMVADEPGEVLVQGPTVMRGYYGSPAATEQVLQDGWLHTGDIGHLDSDGCLWLLQRRSDLIISGGENIYPVEIEKAILAHPAVAEVCVVGLPDPEWGQRPAALVVLKPEQTLNPPVLIDYLRSFLASYKIPRSVYFVVTLPMTSSGKVSRRFVLEELIRLEGENHA